MLYCRTPSLDTTAVVVVSFLLTVFECRHLVAASLSINDILVATSFNPCSILSCVTLVNDCTLVC